MRVQTSSQSGVVYQLRLDSVTQCGKLCREITMTLENTGSEDANDVLVDTVLLVDGDPVWSGTTDVGTLPAGEKYQASKKVKLSPEDGTQVKQNNYVVSARMVIRSSEGDSVFERRINAKTLEPVQMRLPDFNEGSLTEISLDGTTYYLINDLPNHPPNRDVVTNTDYRPVDLETAERVIGHDVFQGLTWGNDWASEIDTTRKRREDFKNMEVIGHAIELGWNVTEVLIFISTGVPAASLGTALDVTTDAIDWSTQDVEKPYRENFQKMAGCLQNGKVYGNLAEDMESYRATGSTLEAYLGSLMDVSAAADEGAALASAWSQVFKEGAETGARKAFTSAASQSTGFFVGFVVSAAVGQVENVVRTKSNLYAAAYAYTSLRLPILERVKALHRRLANGEHRTGDGIEYWLQLQSVFQMDALAYHTNGKYWQAISDSTTGVVWDNLANADDRAAESHEVGKTKAETARIVGSILGTAMNTIDDRTRQSINASVEQKGSGRLYPGVMNSGRPAPLSGGGGR